MPAGVDLGPFYVGARLLGLRSVGPQQLEIASLLLAEDGDGKPAHSEVTILEPRRASKTTSIWCVLLGLCATRPDFKVVVTAQTYVKARERFLEVARALAPRNIGDYRILKGAAAEAIEWTNGSRLWVVTPEGSAFRGDAADRILFDEAQEHGPTQTADLLGGALALMDTRMDEADLDDDEATPDAQVIITGTTGKVRHGMLWDALERGRAGHVGILEYAVPDGVMLALDVKTDEGRQAVEAGAGLDKTGRFALNEPAIRAAHPGIGTLTSMKVIRDRFSGMPLEQFCREYGGQWPFTLDARAISPENWAAITTTARPERPERFAIAYDIAPDQSVAAIVAAWRDPAGRATLEVIDHRAGDAWLPRALYDLSKAHPGLHIGYDNIHSANVAVADRLTREARPKPKLIPLGTREVTAAAAQASQEIDRRVLRVVQDPALDAAAEVATRRRIGDASWAWGRRASGGDIAALVAGTNALKVWDTDSRTRVRAEGEQVRIITRRAS